MSMVSPLAISRSISRLACSEYGGRSLRSTVVPPCTNSELLGKEPLLIRFSNAEVSNGGGTVPGGSGRGGTTGQVGGPNTHGVGRNMLFKVHCPVCWLLLVGSPGRTGG